MLIFLDYKLLNLAHVAHFLNNKIKKFYLLFYLYFRRLLIMFLNRETRVSLKIRTTVRKLFDTNKPNLSFFVAFLSISLLMFNR
jgi:hypothetical protein